MYFHRGNIGSEFVEAPVLWYGSKQIRLYYEKIEYRLMTSSKFQSALYGFDNACLLQQQVCYSRPLDSIPSRPELEEALNGIGRSTYVLDT